MRSLVLAALLCLAAVGTASGQQVVDDTIDVSVARPVFDQNAGPTVTIDGAHHNLHAVDGLYAPFAALLRNDGFRVSGSTAPFTKETLAHETILVISNALNAVNVDNWVLPTPSAFTADEIATVKAWVNDGGALLLIADHMPFPGGAMDLAHAFGFEFLNGTALSMNNDRDIFTRAEGTLANDPVARGRSPDETVLSVETFGGSVRFPEAARPLLVFPKPYIVMITPEALTAQNAALMVAISPHLPAEGLSQGAVMKSGKGRIAVFGEAAMFSAQFLSQGGAPFGFNIAPGNKQFVLNIVHWLSGALPE
jgi:hypothetical protein